MRKAGVGHDCEYSEDEWLFSKYGIHQWGHKVRISLMSDMGQS